MNTYSIAVSDQADADIERLLNRLVMVSVEAAAAFQARLEEALAKLTSLPNRCPRARDGDRYPSVVARQLYFGQYRIVFHVIEADADETEGTVVVLRVLYGSQSLRPEKSEEERL